MIKKFTPIKFRIINITISINKDLFYIHSDHIAIPKNYHRKSKFVIPSKHIKIKFFYEIRFAISTKVLKGSTTKIPFSVLLNLSVFMSLLFVIQNQNKNVSQHGFSFFYIRLTRDNIYCPPQRIDVC